MSHAPDQPDPGANRSTDAADQAADKAAGDAVAQGLDRLARADGAAFDAGMAAGVASAAALASDRATAVLERDAQAARAGFTPARAARTVAAAVEVHEADGVVGTIGPTRGSGVLMTFARRALAASVLIAGGGLGLFMAMQGETTGLTDDATGEGQFVLTAETFAADLADAWTALDDDVCGQCVVDLQAVGEEADALDTLFDVDADEQRWGEWASDGWAEGAS